MKESEEVGPPAPEYWGEFDGVRHAIDNAHPVIRKALNALWALCGVAAGAAYWAISWWVLLIMIGNVIPSLPSAPRNYGVNVVEGIVGILISLALMRRRIKFGLYLLIGILISGVIGVKMEIDWQNVWIN